ncbi:hypothetical protein MASR1M12_35670 [Erysipelotrichia bacterium]
MVKTETKWHNNSRSGFTLLELLVVVGILAALVALALPFYQDYVNQSKMTAAEADLQTFKKALAMYDQFEPSMFAASDMTKLIGKYLQDYRTFADQKNPVDPWNTDYFVSAQEGVVLSHGPDGIRDTTDAALPDRIALDDDLLVTWKPPFFVSGARPINPTTIEVSFSRKLSGNPTATVGAIGITVQKVSDSVFRLVLATPMTKGTSYTVTVTAAASQDGKSSFDPNPDGTDTTGFKATFTY